MPTTTVRRDAENLQSSGQGPPVEVRVGSSLSCLRDGSDSTYVQVSFSDINADEQGYFDADIAGIGSGIVIESIVMNLRAAGYAPETEISGFPNRAPFYLELYGTTGDTYAHWYVYMPDDASLTPVSYSITATTTNQSNSFSICKIDAVSPLVSQTSGVLLQDQHNLGDPGSTRIYELSFDITYSADVAFDPGVVPTNLGANENLPELTRGGLVPNIRQSQWNF